MDLPIDFEGITRIFERAWDQGRDYSFEYQVYDLPIPQPCKSREGFSFKAPRLKP